MEEDLAKIGAHIDAFEYCPYHPEAVIERYRLVSPRRKPAPGMINELLERFPVDVGRSILIGDRPTDLEAAQAAGIKGYLFSGHNLVNFLTSILSPKENLHSSSVPARVGHSSDGAPKL
jgi:D-glycero-D-manno-heptose 1,7-bisphosphate phosphatase